MEFSFFCCNGFDIFFIAKAEEKIIQAWYYGFSHPTIFALMHFHLGNITLK